MTWDRRKFLSGLGTGLAGTALLPYIPLMPKEVEAADGVPKRLFVFYNSNGTHTDDWRPRGSETDFELSPMLEPLAPYRGQMVLVDGVHMESARSGSANFHARAGFNCLTGVGSSGRGRTSVDQIVADRLGAKPFRSIHLGSATGAGHSASSSTAITVTYHSTESRSDQRVFPYENPSDALSELFQGASPGPDPALVRRGRILEAVDEQLGSIKSRVGGEGAAKIEAHRALLEDIRKRVDRPMVCTRPELDTGSIPALRNVGIRERDV